jgi:hypothetical protein
VCPLDFFQESARKLSGCFYLKQFAQEGLAKVPNEDVWLCLEQIAAVCARVAKFDALPPEALGYILEGFSWCLVVEFRDIHKLLATTDKVRQMQAVSGRWYSITTRSAVHNLCSKAKEVFHSLNFTNNGIFPRGTGLMLLLQLLQLQLTWPYQWQMSSSMWWSWDHKGQGGTRQVYCWRACFWQSWLVLVWCTRGWAINS